MAEIIFKAQLDTSEIDKEKKDLEKGGNPAVQRQLEAGQRKLLALSEARRKAEEKTLQLLQKQADLMKRMGQGNVLQRAGNVVQRGFNMAQMGYQRVINSQLGSSEGYTSGLRDNILDSAIGAGIVARGSVKSQYNKMSKTSRLELLSKPGNAEVLRNYRSLRGAFIKMGYPGRFDSEDDAVAFGNKINGGPLSPEGEEQMRSFARITTARRAAYRSHMQNRQRAKAADVARSSYWGKSGKLSRGFSAVGRLGMSGMARMGGTAAVLGMGAYSVASMFSIGNGRVDPETGERMDSYTGNAYNAAKAMGFDPDAQYSALSGIWDSVTGGKKAAGDSKIADAEFMMKKKLQRKITDKQDWLFRKSRDLQIMSDVQGRQNAAYAGYDIQASAAHRIGGMTSAARANYGNSGGPNSPDFTSEINKTTKAIEAVQYEIQKLSNRLAP